MAREEKRIRKKEKLKTELRPHIWIQPSKSSCSVLDHAKDLPSDLSWNLAQNGCHGHSSADVLLLFRCHSMFSSRHQHQSHYLYNQLVPGQIYQNIKGEDDKASHKEWQRDQQLHYLTDYNIIRTSVIVQLLVPFLHHSTLTIIISLQVKQKYSLLFKINKCAQESGRKIKIIHTWITRISSRIRCPTSPSPPRPTVDKIILTSSLYCG